MPLDYSSLEKAIVKLEKSISYVHSDLAKSNPELREQFRAAAIHAYEYTYELGMKMLSRLKP